MAVSATVESEADKFLEKCGEEVKTEPKKLASKLHAVSAVRCLLFDCL